MIRRRIALFTALTALVASVGAVPSSAAAKKTKAKAAKSRVVFQNQDGIYQFPRRTKKWTTPPAAAFRPCFDILDCALVEAPMNYADPLSPALELSVVRHKATDPARRLGVLFVNPGGPGASANGLIRGAARIFPPEVVARFDIVGLDPRGTTNSAQISCGLDPLDPSIIDTDSALRAVAKACKRSSGQLLKYIDTESSVRDHEWVRQALGEEQVNFLGFSYGGYLGAMYAQLFPNTLRSVVLDSGIDDTNFGTNLLEAGYAANERTLRAFLQQCQDGTYTPCAFNNGTDLLARYDGLLAYYSGSRRKEQARSRFEGIVGDLLEGQATGGWKVLADGLAQAANRPTSDPYEGFDLRSFRPRANYEVLETIFAYQCRDGFFTRTQAELDAMVARIPTSAPHFAVNAKGSAELYRICQYWPEPIKQQPKIVPNGIAPVLLVGATLDLVTPIEWQQSMIATTGGTLVTRVGADHGQVGRGTCVDAYAVDFMVNLTLPAPGIICQN
jgi:pimeloyl-ACP methyl ester carboxylesterase